MTDREAMQQALAALDRVMSHGSAVQEAKDILRERLEQPQRTHWEGCEEVHPECKKPEREPVAWLVQYSNKHEFVWGQKPQWIADAIGIEPLYTAPQRREWVGLTVAERKKINRLSVYVESAISLTEAKLKEKNNG